MKNEKHAVIGGDIFHFLSGRIEDKQFGEIAEQVSRYHHENGMVPDIRKALRESRFRLLPEL